MRRGGFPSAVKILGSVGPRFDGERIALCRSRQWGYSFAKMKTVEAIIETNGEVRLAEPIHVLTPRRALVTILEEAPAAHDTALLSEAALAEDWNRAEEDAAWAHLQPAK